MSEGKSASNISYKNDADAEDSPYENMIRSFTNRGKNKRKVKLVEDKLIQFAFGDSDSDDDEDFTLDSDKEVDSDHSDYVSHKSDDGDESSNDDEGEKNDDDGEQSDDDDDDQPLKPLKLGELLDTMKQNENKSIATTDDDGEEEDEVASQDEGDFTPAMAKTNRLKMILVCGICLESVSNEADEILECDNCGITVHEGCYGDIDMPDDDNKSDSDAPTEPWFCEPCKAGLAESPICELCPNSGGIFKLTDSKKWVHLICALYTPYVGFRDVSKLETVVLEDIRCSMWAGKECMFCPDDNFSRTGVCISCDAGLCKSTFHVTCGQMNGFLSDIPDKREEEEADNNCPDLLYAHCKLHSVKTEVAKRKRGWLSFQAHVQKFRKSDDTDEERRIVDALHRSKQDFIEYQRNIIQPKQPANEYHRMLSSCPEACMMLAKKAEILGMLKHPGYNVAAAITSGKLVKHEPNLSAEFLNYFYKREMESKQLIKALNNAQPLLDKLEKEQKDLTKESEDCSTKLDKVRADKENLRRLCTKLHTTLHRLSGRSFKLPTVLKPKQLKENKGKLEESTKLLNTIVNRCATCKQTTDQHLLAQCDTCKQHYHLSCVDPPLTRMPKRSDNYLWQCTECDASDESEVETEDSDGDGVRRNKKRNAKEPKKFEPDETSKGKGNEKTPVRSAKRKSTGGASTSEKKKKKRKKSVDAEKQPSKRKSYVKVKVPVAEKLDDCCICMKSGDKSSLVKCDECLKCYHFKSCLNPPCAKTPKGRYYGWICEDCDDSDDSMEEDEKENEEEGDVKKE